MNALSSIHGFVQPNGLITLLPNIGQKPGAQQIPAAELKQLSSIAAPSCAPAIQPVSKPADGSFASVLGNMVHEVNAKQTAANAAIDGLLTGKNVSLHDTMIAVEEASVSFQLMVETRNKLLESYQELMRMQI